MLSFYLIAGGLAVLAAAVLVRPLIARRGVSDARDARDAQVFRDQLAEIDRDLARGTITANEAEGARIEVSRRLIAADERARRGRPPAPAPVGHSGLVAALALIGTPALAAALYFGIGAPGVPDQPFAERQGFAVAPEAGARPSQAEAEAEMAGRLPAPAEVDPQYADLIARLEQTVAERPDDVQGQRLLANSLMQLGRFAEAWRAYDRVIELSENAAGAEVHSAKAEGMIMAAGGYVSPEAADEIAASLERDPTLPVARYYAGLALRQAGRIDDAIAMWEGLRRDSAPDAPYLEWVDMMLADAVAARNGPPPGSQAGPAAGAGKEAGMDAVTGAGPGAGPGAGTGAGPGAGTRPGPGQAEIEVAERLSPEQRAAMIEGMVARLDARLAGQGGSVDEWARLIASYAALGRQEEARGALDRGLAALGPGAEGDALRAQAQGLGMSAGGPGPAPGSMPESLSAPGSGPGPGPAPTEEDISAAGRMTPEERAAMIAGMVARLEDRLTSDGGTAEEWLRLIRSYVQLERREEAARAYRLAARALAGDPSAGFVKEQAMLMGVTVE